MSYLSFDEISDRYNQLSQVDLTEEDLAVAEAIYLNIVNTLVEKSHTATGVLKFLETQVNDENIFDFATEEKIEITEGWGNHLAKWEKDLLLFNVEGYKLELMESSLAGLGRTLVRALSKNPVKNLTNLKRMRAVHRSTRLGKPQKLGQQSSDAAMSGGKTGAYRSTGSGGKTSLKSTADDVSVPTSGTALRKTPGAEKATQNRSQRADYRVKKKADQIKNDKLRAQGKDPLRIKKRDVASVAGQVATGAAITKIAIDAVKNGGKDSKASNPPASQEPPKPKPTGVTPAAQAAATAADKAKERQAKIDAWVYQNPRKARQMASGDRDYAQVQKQLRKMFPEWMENYPELAQTINEQKEVTEMNNQTHDAYDIILDYLLENGHAETMDEANYVMLEMDEEHLQKIVQLSSES